MRYIYLIVALFAVSCTKEIPEPKNVMPPEVLFNMCECTDGEKVIYRKRLEVDGVITNTYYSNADGLLNFNTHYGENSPLIYDFNGSGIVDSGDLISLLSGYGETPPPYDLCDVDVNMIFSHGWDSEYPGSWECFVHPTLIDEDLVQGEYCPINTFWVEIIYMDSVVKLWYH
jgi:hypothetical protein